MKTKRCEVSDGVISKHVACAGPLWVCKGYFLKGRGIDRNLYACEAHAKQHMRMNPPAFGGTRFELEGGAR